MSNDKLVFKISSGLKNIIGQELINDKMIAIFEIVKNSYDASAKNVRIEFKNIYQSDTTIEILDDGNGMSLEDIKNKWLFVAYSEKKLRGSYDYRDNIKRKYAGAKGVGRFSCDRLGSGLKLISKTAHDLNCHQLIINWNKFDENDKNEFINIPVEYSIISDGLDSYAHGTKIIISNLRDEWDRESLLSLKNSLKKLINPDQVSNLDKFSVTILVDEEKDNDLNESDAKYIINGTIINDVFEKLNIKTTSVCVTIDDKGETIKTRLCDRGEFIFEVIEENAFKNLKSISIYLAYLNRAAKVNFTNIMGTQPVNYGSVFIYKNNFRILPYGEPGQDFFDIDKRKGQGYARFLGTRDVMGRISISGVSRDFIETSSRAGGFIQNAAVKDLELFFKQNVLIVLEKYVRDIILWGNPSKEEFDRGVEQGLMPEEVLDKIVENFISFAKKGKVLNIQYNDDIISYLNAKDKESLVSSIDKLEIYAKDKMEPPISKLVDNIKSQFITMQKYNDELQKEVVTSQKNHEKILKEIERTDNQNYFLKHNTNKNIAHLLGGHHSVLRSADGLEKNIYFLIASLKKNNNAVYQANLKILSSINIVTKKIKKISSYALKGDFSLSSDKIKSDIVKFIRQLVSVSQYPLIVEVEDTPHDFICSFEATSIGIIIDNIISNSMKADASILQIYFNFGADYVDIHFRDNGIGLDKGITDIDKIFTLGYSNTKDGFGVGLYQIKDILNRFKGTVNVNMDYTDGFELIIRVIK